VKAAMKAKINVVNVVLINMCVEHLLDMMQCRLGFVNFPDKCLP
jgi:hypothetical protein